MMSAKDKAIEMGMKYKEDSIFIELFDEEIVEDKPFITIDKQDKLITIENDKDFEEKNVLIDLERFNLLLMFVHELGWNDVED